MRFRKVIFVSTIIGVLIGLGIVDWLHLAHRLKSEQVVEAPKVLATPDAEPAVSPAASPVIAGQSSVRLAQYHTQLTVVDPIADLVYGEVKSGAGPVIGFTTATLLAKYPRCTAGALGTLVRVKASLPPTPSPSKSPAPSLSPRASAAPALPFKKYIDGYIYSYKSPLFTCVSDQAGRNALAAALAAIKNQALPTLSAQSADD